MREIVRMQFGSHVYGTNLPTSDIDFKAVFIPSYRDIILGKTRDAFNETTKQDRTQKSTADDIECEHFSLKKFITLLLASQTVPIGMLFTPEKWYQAEPHAAWLEIIQNKDKFLCTQLKAFVGYCRTQANKYGIKGSRVAAARAIVALLETLIAKHGHLTKLTTVWTAFEDFANRGNIQHAEIIVERLRRQGTPVRMLNVCGRKVQEFTTLKDAYNIYNRVFLEYGHRALQAEKNENVDWKALMHACRVYQETLELLATGFITYPRPESTYLLAVRKGLIPYKTIAEFLEDGFEELEHRVKDSILPQQPDYAFAEDLLFKWYSQA